MTTASDPLVLSRPAEIRAVLADPRFTVDPVPRPPFALTVAWLRGAVGRFAEGAAHAGRRAAAEAVLAALDPGALRAEAFRLASRDTGPPELVPVLVLAVALGVRAEDGPEAVAAVAAIAPAYLPGPGPERGPGPGPGGAGTGTADEGLVRLSRLLGDPPPERLALTAGLLAQAYGPMAGLVRAALAAAPARSATGTWTVAELLDETLRHDPPVRTLRRRAPGGRAVVLDVAAAGRSRDPDTARGPESARTEGGPEYLTFGAGPRACPGRRVALALAAGTIEAAAR
ncbi:cytochrome P450 [Streptosporangium sp. NPDC048865]|uniref:cytochrome P450 n=1 Tax=Streptosporangium sp. NPDC048865 TaxID=3155766 RepID=UPI003424AAE6